MFFFCFNCDMGEPTLRAGIGRLFKMWMSVKAIMLFGVLSFCLTIISFHISSVSRDTHLNVPARRTVLVTGGAGFIGSHAAMMLLEQGNDVIVIDNLSRGSRDALRSLEHFSSDCGARCSLSVVYADLSDGFALDAIFARHSVDVVMHFAAVAFVQESVENPSLYWSNITRNTQILAGAALRAGVRTFVHSSTCAVCVNLDYCCDAIWTLLGDPRPKTKTIPAGTASPQQCLLLSVLSPYL